MRTLLPIERQTPSTPGWSEAQSPSTALQVLEAPLVEQVDGEGEEGSDRGA